MNKKNELFILFVSLVFILSAFGKSINCNDFVNQIIAVGFPELWFSAPIIICLELLIGLSLLFKYRVKLMSLVGVFSIIVFSAVYVYGWVVNGVTDCGCFGRLKMFDVSPWFTMLRNIILICALLYIGQMGDHTTDLREKSIIFCGLVLSLCAFMAGYSLHTAESENSPDFNPVPINESPISDFIDTHPDSTYIVFAFSYTCPHCINSISRLQEYESMKVVDRVIGLAVENEEAEKEFNAYFNPRFKIHNIPADNLKRLTGQFPVSYYIRRDSLSYVMYGELPSAFFVKSGVTKKGE